jgi:hypothetical protein
MLYQVLQEFERARGPLRLDELGRRLGVEEGVLASMIAFWVRKGRLQEVAWDCPEGGAAGGDGACGRSCAESQDCPFALKLPRTFSLVPKD